MQVGSKAIGLATLNITDLLQELLALAQKYGTPTFYDQVKTPNPHLCSILHKS